jgi:hypothetical protein
MRLLPWMAYYVAANLFRTTEYHVLIGYRSIEASTCPEFAIQVRMLGKEPNDTRKEVTEVQVRVDDLLRRTLIEVGDIRTMEERLTEIASRAAKVTFSARQSTPRQK